MFNGISGSRHQLVEMILSNMIQEGLDGEESVGVSQTTMENLRSNATVVSESESSTHQCSICLESINVGESCTSLSCEHVFHLSCIERWCTSHNSCPMCRRPIDTERPQVQTRNQRTQRIIVNNITSVQIAFHINENILNTYWYSCNTIVDIFNYLSQMQNSYARIMLQINSKIFKTTESYEYLAQTLTQHGIVGNVEAYVHIL